MYTIYYEFNHTIHISFVNLKTKCNKWQILLSHVILCEVIEVIIAKLYMRRIHTNYIDETERSDF